MTAWIFQATPLEFDMDAFLASRPAKAKWRASAPGIERRCRAGDRVFLWRAKGDGASALAGVVAEGLVCGAVIKQVDDSAATRFWTDRAAARHVEPRVEIALTRFAATGEMVPMDEVKSDPILCKASIITVRAGSNFALTEEQEVRLSRLWSGGRRKWEHIDLVRALAFYAKSDAPGLAEAQGRYVSECRRTLAAFENCDPTRARAATRPKAAFEAAWNEVFGKAGV